MFVSYPHFFSSFAEVQTTVIEYTLSYMNMGIKKNMIKVLKLFSYKHFLLSQVLSQKSLFESPKYSQCSIRVTEDSKHESTLL